jgi:hypothetical protein
MNTEAIHTVSEWIGAVGAVLTILLSIVVVIICELAYFGGKWYVGRLFRDWSRVVRIEKNATTALQAVDQATDLAHLGDEQQEMGMRASAGTGVPYQAPPSTNAHIKQGKLAPGIAGFAAVLALDVQHKMGPDPKPTDANRVVAWELLMKACVARDVRKADRVRLCTYAREMIFMPSNDLVLALEMRSSQAVARRLARPHLKTPSWIKALMGWTQAEGPPE